MTNKLIEDAVAELETLTGDDYQTEYYPVSADWLRTKLATLLTQQLTELEGDVKGKEKKVPPAFGLGNNPGKAAMRGEKIGYNQAIKDTLTLIAEQKELLAKDNR